MSKAIPQAVKEHALENLAKAHKDLESAKKRAAELNVTADSNLDPVLQKVVESAYTPIIIIVTHLVVFAIGITVGHYAF